MGDATQVAAIAAGLTKAQREAVIRSGGSYRTANALFNMDLFSGLHRDCRANYTFLVRPTALGLAVRAHLMQERP